MEQEGKRAIRRHHVARLKKARADYSGISWFASEYGRDSQAYGRSLGRVVRTATLCSCAMCGNPRRHLNERSVHELSDLEYLALFLDNPEACDEQGSC